jgi:hypothetical protein
LVDIYSDKQPVIKVLHIKDPLTGQTLVRIRDPKLKLKGFTNRGEKCINLQKFMRDKRSSPDFGFDNDEIAASQE